MGSDHTTAVRLLVMAKTPVAGRVKTRLCPPFTPSEAAEIARAAIADTLAAVIASVPMGARRGVRIEPVLVLDGEPGLWLAQMLENDLRGPTSIRVIAQRAGSLDVRLAGAFKDAGGSGPTLLVGMDTPQLTPGGMVRAIQTLATPGCDAVLGPAEDGGWWTLGLRHPDPALLRGVPTSTPETGKAQETRLLEAGLSVSLLEEMLDVDTAHDARRVAAMVPGSRFGRTLDRLQRAAELAA
jgi:rSAM/selenodomain-associated transferase 1